MKWYESDVAYLAVIFIGIWGTVAVIGAVAILGSIYGC